MSFLIDKVNMWYKREFISTQQFIAQQKTFVVYAKAKL